LQIKDNQNISAATFSTLLKNLNTLQSLTLSRCATVDDVVVQALSESLDRLVELDISFCEAVTDLRTNILPSKLQNLNLSYCKVSNKTIQNLIDHNPVLRALSVSGCDQITDEGIATLSPKSLAKLQLLNLRWCNKVTASAVADLETRYNKALTVDYINTSTPNYLKQIASRLLNIATKYTPKGSKIPTEIDYSGQDMQVLIESAIVLRRILSLEVNPPINDVISAGLVPVLINMICEDKPPQLQFEAAWALTNIASGSPQHTASVVDAGAVPLFVKLLQSKDTDVKSQAVWALGNIAGDSAQMRNYVLSNGALKPLLQIVRSLQSSKLVAVLAKPDLALLRNVTWTISNLCRGKPIPDFETVEIAISELVHLLHHATDEEVLTDTCWALSYLSDGPNERIQKIIDTGICKRICELLRHPVLSIVTPALRTAGNVVTGDDQQTQVILNCGLLQALKPLLASPKKSIKKETIWTISNITAGSTGHIAAVVDEGLFPIIVNILLNGDFDLKKEAAWAISNATSGGTSLQIKYLVNIGCLHPLYSVLSGTDTRLHAVALEGLENILKSGKMENTQEYIEMIEGIDGLAAVMKLQKGPVADKAKSLLEFFPEDEDEDEEDEEDEDFVPPANPANPQSFQF